MQTLGIAEQVEQAITPVLLQTGYEVVLVEYVPRAGVLRLFIDKSEGVGVDDCAKVSHLVGDLLDSEGISDSINGRYHLEVSSPGLDRPLVRPKDFQRFLGKKAQLTTREPLSGRRKFAGDIVSADVESVCLSVDGQTWTITYDMIEKARLVPEF